MQEQRRRRRRRQRRREGMNLIEVMVAMVIMAMVGTAVAVGAKKAWDNARKRETATRARTLQQVVTGYLLEPDHDCPSVGELLASNAIDNTTDPNDAWGNAFTIECQEDTVHVHSAGPDENMGTEDDIGF